MLQRITLTNFQSHVKSVLDFHEGLNVIVGTSDSGKTAIIRALVWAAFNKPNGYAFITHGQKAAEVELQFDDACVVRRRTKTVNACRVNGVELSAIGQKIIPEVQEVTRLEDVNVQLQMDAPYLLSLSAPEVARRLNQVANLEEIDAAIKAINAMYREASTKATGLEASLKSIDEELDGIGDLDEMEKRWGKIEKLDAEVIALRLDVDLMESQLSEFIYQSEELEQYEDLPAASNLVSEAREVEDAQREVDTLEAELDEYVALQSEYVDAGLQVAAAEQEYDELKPDECPTCGGEWK
jgi:DNA repair exonuclease SbcCD ATPase subunit